VRGDGCLAAGSWLRGGIGGLGMRDANCEGDTGRGGVLDSSAAVVEEGKHGGERGDREIHCWRSEWYHIRKTR